MRGAGFAVVDPLATISTMRGLRKRAQNGQAGYAEMCSRCTCGLFPLPPPAVILGLDPRIRGGWRAVLKKAVRRAAWRVSQGQAAEALDRLK